MDIPTLMDSEWNGANAYLYRIHVILMQCDEASSKGDNKARLAALYTLHCELIAQMKDEELAEAENLYHRAKRLVNDGRFNIHQEQDRLYNYEKHLRIVLKNRKMDLPRSKDPSKAIL